MLGMEDKQNCASNLSEEQFEVATRERAKFVYVNCLSLVGELVIPWWCLVNYHLCMLTTATSKTIIGYARSGYGMEKITSNAFVKTTLLISVFDLSELFLFTYFVRRKFKSFSPFRVLNMVVKKFKLVLAWSIQAVVVIMLCMYIIDCNFDFKRTASLFSRSG